MEHLWLIAKDSTATIYYRNYTQEKKDPDLVSGLLSAFNNFSEVELHGTGIESINMGGLQWVYLNSKAFGMLAVAADHKRCNADLMRSRLDIILKLFVMKFGITREMVNQPAVCVKGFQAFDDDLDSLREDWRQAESIMDAGELFDLLGVFQQLLDHFMTSIQNLPDPGTRDAIIAALKSFSATFRSLFDVQQYPEFLKVSFDAENGWSVITLDPTKLNKVVLKKGLFAIITNVKSVIVTYAGNQCALLAISRDILPYVFSSWELLEILDLVKPLVMTLLEVR
jgi:hypothetical protein